MIFNLKNEISENKCTKLVSLQVIEDLPVLCRGSEREGRLILNFCMFNSVMVYVPQQILHDQIIALCGQESTHFSTTVL
jgi:hypothetical protein